MAYTTISPYSVHERGNMERDVELFRRLLESLSNQPVDVITEKDTYGLGSYVRVYFRHIGFYMMVNVDVFVRGRVPIEEYAMEIYKNLQDHMKATKSKAIESAYRSMADFEPEWKIKKGTSVDPTTLAKPKKLVLPKEDIVWTEIPIRKEFQQKVDAWLK